MLVSIPSPPSFVKGGAPSLNSSQSETWGWSSAYARNASGDDVATIWFFNGTGYSVFELPRFGAATTSRGLAAAGDGFSLGGSVGSDAAVWNGLTFEARRLADYVAGLGLTIPPECTLSNVTDMDLTGVRLVGEATCDTGAGPFTRVYELETPVPLPEPGFGVASLLGALGLFLSKSRSPR